MKLLRLLIFLLILLKFLSFDINAQAPDAFNFQGVATDLNGNPLINKSIGLEFALIKGDPQGSILYLESHQVTTDAFALFSIAIGRGHARIGDISDISWGDGPIFMRTALDENGGENYRVVGTSELLSVPYALYALNTGTGEWEKNDSTLYYNSSYVGLGTPAADERLHIKDGNVFIENTANGLIQSSPDGQCWILKASNNGAIFWERISCPNSINGNQNEILISPSSLSFSLNQNSKSISITNNTDNTINWTMSFPSETINLNKSSGNLTPNSTEEIVVTLNRENMPREVIEYTIEFTSNQSQIRNITVLVDNNRPRFRPQVNILFPVVPADFYQGETINFRAEASDIDTPFENLTVVWKSDLDSIIYEGSLNEAGVTSFSTSELSKGVHLITASVTDDDQLEGNATIQVSTLAPQPVVLSEPIKSEEGVNLSWSEYVESDFRKYDVYRKDGNCTQGSLSLITSITDSNITSFVDKLSPFESQVCYYVSVINDSSKSSNSNQEVVENPNGHIFDFLPHDVLIHPTENFIYLIDQAGSKIYKYDYVNQEIVQETETQGKIGYCALGDNGFGLEIYTPSDDGWIYVYEAQNLNLTFSINVGVPATSVSTNNTGYVIAGVAPSPWWEQPVRTYKRSNGLNLDGNGDHAGDRVMFIPGKNESISISTGISPTDMEYFNLTNEGLIESHVDDQYHGDFPLDAKIFRISPNGEFTITSRNGAVYLANSSMEYVGQLQRGALNFSDYSFSDDGNVIYAGTSNRKSIQIGAYPSLIRSDEILTKGYPFMIMKSGNNIISVSKTEENSNKTGIEIIKL